MEYIFIIPYRNRETHKHFFLRQMKYLLEDYDPLSYEIIFAHQNNNLPFNRGAMKNIGFLYAKSKYPNYKSIQFIFNDLDTLPYKKGLLNYKLNSNEIKHYYGFKFALGGIFSIKGEDFEKIDGFPNLWSWGYEDTIIYNRAISKNIIINRDQFYEIGHPNILHLIDEFSKNISLKNKNLYEKNEIFDGLSSLKNVSYVWNGQMLDVNTHECSYDSNDQTLVSNLEYVKPKIIENKFKNMLKNIRE